MPRIVTRPVIASIASVTRLSWRSVVGLRHWLKHVTTSIMSGMGGCSWCRVGVGFPYSTQCSAALPHRHFGEGIVFPMPLFGQLNLQTVLSRLPEMQDFETEPWELPGADILHLAFEVGQERADASLPRAMHPAVPRYITCIISHFPQTPVGPFHLAQLRLMGR